MKIITVPDLHGRNHWNTINPIEYDKIIFLGDYVDSPTILATKIIANLVDIIDFKKKYPDKVELLIGNHDCQYLYYPKHRISGFMLGSEKQLSEIFKKNSHLFKFAYQFNDHLWTHAGVSKTWFDFAVDHFNKTLTTTTNTMADILNDLAATDFNILNSCSPIRGGDDLASGIIWADKSETMADYVDFIHQHVGHSKVKEILMCGNKISSIQYLDCLSSKVEFSEIDL